MLQDATQDTKQGSIAKVVSQYRLRLNMLISQHQMGRLRVPSAGGEEDEVLTVGGDDEDEVKSLGSPGSVRTSPSMFGGGAQEARGAHLRKQMRSGGSV